MRRDTASIPQILATKKVPSTLFTDYSEVVSKYRAAHLSSASGVFDPVELDPRSRTFPDTA
jgi:hypothetical protein